MDKIQKLLTELSEEIEDRFGVEPNIEINVHATTHDERFKLEQANRKMAALRKDGGIKIGRQKLTFQEDDLRGDVDHYLCAKFEANYRDPVQFAAHLYFHTPEDEEVEDQDEAQPFKRFQETAARTEAEVDDNATAGV